MTDSLLTRGVAEVIVQENLAKRLQVGDKLRVKLGIDPTAPILHLGHAVVLHKLKEFQDLGHQVIFLIGDFTARIGDPTGRVAARPALSQADIEANLKTYVEQAGKILDVAKVEIRRNSEWYESMTAAELVGLTSKVTFSQIAHRADFKQRIESEVDFTLQEFMYPVLQGYDSVMLKADVEIGGTDQKFNLLMGRQIQKRYDQAPQDVMTCSLLEGLSGGDKMSKSLDNYIALAATASDMFAALMSLADQLIPHYFELAAFADAAEVAKIKEQLAAGTNPRDLKLRLAREIVALYHNPAAAAVAEKNFVDTFSKKIVPTEMPSVAAAAGDKLVDALLRANIIASKSDWRRLVKEGAVHDLDADQVLADPEVLVQNNWRLKIGKKRFVIIKTN